MNSGKGIIFDMDGVLIDSAEAHFHAWHSLGEELGTLHSREFFNSTFGMHNNQIMPLWLGPQLSAAESQRLATRKELIFRSVVREHLRALPGVPDFIHAVKEHGYRCAVGSSGPRANVELALDLLGIRHLFDHLTTGDDVSQGKPHPEVFLKAAAGLQLKPHRAVVIEDAVQGVQAALAGNFPVIALTTSRPAEDLLEAHHISENLSTLSIEQVEQVERRFDQAASHPR